MKPSALWLFFLLGSAVLRGAPFEGKVQFHRADLPGKPHDVIYWVKGEQNRVEVWRERAKAFLTDTRKEQTTAILEDDRAYIVLPWLKPPPDTPPLEKTGETTRLLGYTVLRHVVVTEEDTTELWLAEGLGRYTGLGEGYEKRPEHVPGVDIPELPDPRPWEYALAETFLFPLRVITRDASGRETFRLEARVITPQALDDRLFKPSPTYTQVENWPKG